MSYDALFPTPSKQSLVDLYKGKSIGHVPTPAAVMDVAAVRRNCARMLQACKSLDLGWRAHVKTHKTAELTKLQVGDDPSLPVNLIVSTLGEAEFLLPLLKEYRSQGRKVNVLYGLPISQNAVPRLSDVARALGQGSISILIDDPAQLAIASSFKEKSGGVTPHAHIKIDMGGRRAGVIEDSDRFVEVADAALDAHVAGHIVLSGLYSHAGHSYGGDSRVAALKMMAAEISAMVRGADRLTKRASEKGVSNLPALVVSAGASPTAIAVQNLLTGPQGGAPDNDSAPAELKEEASSLSSLLSSVKKSGHVVEIHAGVYPTLDLQQLAAHSTSTSHQSWRDIALTVVGEVHSYYPGRGADGTDEALVGAGGLALGREFCKAYDGMAMLTPWGRTQATLPDCEVEDYEGWMVGRFAQEHGILTWGKGKRRAGEAAGPQAPKQDVLEVGQRVRLWPNHACITSSHFGWYVVVDSDREDGDEIVDVWVKARGW